MSLFRVIAFVLNGAALVILNIGYRVDSKNQRIKMTQNQFCTSFQMLTIFALFDFLSTAFKGLETRPLLPRNMMMPSNTTQVREKYIYHIPLLNNINLIHSTLQNVNPTFTAAIALDSKNCVYYSNRR